MREEFIEKVKHTRITCDFCKGEHKGWHIKKCRMCERDICTKCAVITDDTYLRDGAFNGDYPDYYCKECWEKGASEITSILQLRDVVEEQESTFLSVWRLKCK